MAVPDHLSPTASFGLSTAGVDEAWDRFVEAHPWGQFQQSTLWAQAKAAEGWGAVRLLFRDGESLLGGAQVLTRTTRFGRVGFVNKGPLVHPDWTEGPNAVARALTDLQAAQDWRCLLTQPPDLGATLLPPLRRAGFRQEHLLAVIDSTLVMDLSGGWECAQAKFRRTVRQKMRRSLKRGVVIVEGDEDDLPDFFRLMVETCASQRVRPNPSSVEALVALWRPFRACGKARLGFAEYQGARLAGGLCVAFGPRVWIWKVGWNQKEAVLHASNLVACDAIRWAAERGYQSIDWVSIDRGVAEAMIAGRELGDNAQHRKAFFKLGFGGQARLLPPCLVRFRNPLLRMAYGAATLGAWRGLTRTLLRRNGKAASIPAVEC